MAYFYYILFNTNRIKAQIGLSAAGFGAQGGVRLGWVLGPRVARIAAPHIAPDIGIRGRPEAYDILCDLHRYLPW